MFEYEHENQRRLLLDLAQKLGRDDLIAKAQKNDPQTTRYALEEARKAYDATNGRTRVRWIVKGS